MNRARSEGYAVEAVNQGVHGYGLGAYALQVDERLSAWHPDMVVLCLFLGNDLHDNFTAVASPAVPRFHMSGGEVVYLPVSPADARTWCSVALGLLDAREAFRLGLMTKEGERYAMDHYFHQIPSAQSNKETTP